MPVPRPHTASATGTNTFEPRQTTTMQGVFVVLADLDIGSNTEDARANDRPSTNARSTGNVNSDVPMLIETLLQRSNPTNRANTDTRNSNPFLANVGQPMVFRLPPPGPGYNFASTSRRSSSASNNETGARPRNRSRTEASTQATNTNPRERTLSSMLQRSGVSALHQTFRFGSTTGTESSAQTGGEICCTFMLRVCECSCNFAQQPPMPLHRHLPNLNGCTSLSRGPLTTSLLKH
mmetsp:Transcript_24000/g.78083  ORF Transcript_24000/g.78083 Transcript_24000/m.78083 type:complete len:236 (+) Transcript_24000:631-1338(+)